MGLGIAQIISSAVTFPADLGMMAIYALLFNRKKAALVIKLLASRFVAERTYRIRETLRELENIRFPNKSETKNLFAILAKLGAQMKPISQLEALRQEVLASAEIPGNLTEAFIQRIVHETYGILEELNLADFKTFLDRAE